MHLLGIFCPGKTLDFDVGVTIALMGLYIDEGKNIRGEMRLIGTDGPAILFQGTAELIVT